MTRKITYIILLLTIFSMRAWAEDANYYAYDLALGALFLCFILFLFTIIIGLLVSTDSSRWGSLIIIASILGMVIVAIAALGNLDGLANILDKITFFR